MDRRAFLKAAGAGAAATHGLEQRTMDKVTWRLLPILIVCFFIAYLDRVNIGFANATMSKDLALSATAFGGAAGIFFIGYFLFEVPSNLALNKFGARVWIARILISWGLVAAANAFVQTAAQLYVARFLLGVAEAGFFPGIIVYLTCWFRKQDQAASVALFAAAIPVSYLVGAPLSTWIMDHVTAFGLSGWRWMLLLEGIPAVLGGAWCYFFLTDGPQQATWLSEAENALPIGELATDTLP